MRANSKEEISPISFILKIFGLNLFDEAITFGTVTLSLMTFNLKPEMLTANRDRKKVEVNENSNEEFPPFHSSKLWVKFV